MNLKFTPMNKKPESKGFTPYTGASNQIGPNQREISANTEVQAVDFCSSQQEAVKDLHFKKFRAARAEESAQNQGFKVPKANGERTGSQALSNGDQKMAFQAVPIPSRYTQAKRFVGSGYNLLKGGLEVARGGVELYTAVKRAQRARFDVVQEQQVEALKVKASPSLSSERTGEKITENPANSSISVPEKQEQVAISVYKGVAPSPFPRVKLPPREDVNYCGQMTFIIFVGYQAALISDNVGSRFWPALMRVKNFFDQVTKDRLSEKNEKGLEKKETENSQKGDLVQKSVVQTISKTTNKVHLDPSKALPFQGYSGHRTPSSRILEKEGSAPVSGGVKNHQDEDNKKTEPFKECVLRNSLTLKDGKKILSNTIGRVVYPPSNGERSKFFRPVRLDFAVPTIVNKPFGENVYLTGKETYSQASYQQKACSVSLDLKIPPLKNPSFSAIENALNQTLKKEFGLEEDILYGVGTSPSIGKQNKNCPLQTPHLVKKKSRDKLLGLVEHLGISNEFGLYVHGNTRTLCRIYRTQILTSSGVWVNNFLHRKKLNTINCDTLSMLGKERFRFLLEESRWNKDSKNLEILWRGVGGLDTLLPIVCQNKLDSFVKESSGITLQELTDLHLGPDFEWSF